MADSGMVKTAGIKDPCTLNPVGDKLIKERNQTSVLMGRQFHKEKPPADWHRFDSHSKS